MVKAHILDPNYQSLAEFQVYFMLQAGYLELRTPLFDFFWSREFSVWFRQDKIHKIKAFPVILVKNTLEDLF